MPRDKGDAALRNSLRSTREFESFGDALRGRHVDDVNSTDVEQGRLAKGASSAVQQKFQDPGGGSFARKLDMNLRRGKARQGIVNRGDNAIRNQQLKDRLQLAKGSIERKGAIQQTSVNALRLEQGLEASELSARNQVNSAFTGAVGFTAGAAARGFQGNFNDNKTPQGSNSSVGFFDSNVDNFDFSQIGTGTQGTVPPST